MKVRSYQLGEERAIWRVYYGSTRNIVGREYTREQVERWAPDSFDMENWKKRLAQKNPFVALIADKIVGFAELEPDGHIDRFYCHHKFQRQGIGSALMREVLAEAGRMGVTRLFAEVSITARDFFLAKGFTIDEETNNIVCGCPAKQYRMSKQVNP